MQLSHDYMQSTIQGSTIGTEREPTLFDESHIIRLNRQHQDRETYVRSKLRNGYVTSQQVTERSQLKTTLSANKSVRAKQIQEQIEAVKAERQRIIQEGERQVRDYMEQLRREQEEFAEESKNMREADEKLQKEFLEEIDRLNKRLEASRKPLEEIREQIKSRIEKDQQTTVTIQSFESKLTTPNSSAQQSPKKKSPKKQ